MSLIVDAFCPSPPDPLSPEYRGEGEKLLWIPVICGALTFSSYLAITVGMGSLQFAFGNSHSPSVLNVSLALATIASS